MYIKHVYKKRDKNRTVECDSKFIFQIATIKWVDEVNDILEIKKGYAQYKDEYF